LSKFPISASVKQRQTRMAPTHNGLGAKQVRPQGDGVEIHGTRFEDLRRRSLPISVPFTARDFAPSSTNGLEAVVCSLSTQIKILRTN
jgi:hypothetical protein